MIDLIKTMIDLIKQRPLIDNAATAPTAEQVQHYCTVAAQMLATTWVSCKDCLPNLGEVVLVATTQDFGCYTFAARHIPDDPRDLPFGWLIWEFSSGPEAEADALCASAVTHWMPVPAAPKAGGRIQTSPASEGDMA